MNDVFVTLGTQMVLAAALAATGQLHSVPAAPAGSPKVHVVSPNSMIEDVRQVLAEGVSGDQVHRYNQVETLYEASVLLDVGDFPADIEALVLPLLDHEQEDVRMAAIDLLAKCGGARTSTALAGIASDRTRHVGERVAAVEGLGLIGGQEATLVRIVEEESNGEIRAVAADSLGKLRYWPAVKVLEHTYMNSRNDEFKCALLKALAAIGDRSSVRLLVSALRSPHETIVTAAAEGLHFCGDERAIDALFSTMDREDLSQDARFWAEAAIFYLLPDVNQGASLEDVRKSWLERKGTYRIEICLRTLLRNCASTQKAIQIISRVSNLQLRSLAPDLLQLLDSNLGEANVVRLVALTTLGSWRNIQGLYGLVGFLDSRGSNEGDGRDSNARAARNRALRVLRKVTGQNFYSDAGAWLNWLERLLRNRDQLLVGSRSVREVIYAQCVDLRNRASSEATAIRYSTGRVRLSEFNESIPSVLRRPLPPDQGHCSSPRSFGCSFCLFSGWIGRSRGGNGASRRLKGQLSGGVGRI